MFEMEMMIDDSRGRVLISRRSAEKVPCGIIFWIWD
jgi:hypothetical protein